MGVIFKIILALLFLGFIQFIVGYAMLGSDSMLWVGLGAVVVIVLLVWLVMQFRNIRW